MTKTNKKDYVSLEWVPYIHYPLHSQKDIANVRALIDSGSKLNTMTPVYTSKLGLKFYPTNIGAQKIDSCNFEIFGIVLASFQVEDKLGRTRFFQETFLLDDISVEVVLGMLFLAFNNVDV